MTTSKKTSSPEQTPLEEAYPTTVEGLVLEERLGYALRRAQLKVFKHFDEAMREHDIRPAQFSSLVVIEGYPGVTQSNLAQTLSIDPPRVVSLINSLEERGLALRVRCKRDRRSHGIFLTKTGEALVDRLKGLAEQSDLEATQSLSEIERRQLLTLLRKVYASEESDD
ncbi:MarR family winged helix-turn-helix transcriptional regulator [Chromohalobacter sp. TMW 2.2308]|uniref:MarR family winged helix-turn-helix transcriptional regulator n=1 Tax=Chromohalobacter moromii TaxID=2860329 RepID=A0A9X3AXE4_9GAMM|nr:MULTISPECIES: MarR family winged helix-turn-helix transcriptional regulator [Chromohalobacter]CDQ34126.1 Nicotinate degradation protein R [Virgibacillus halodenitrificans]MCK2043135.1 MarR family winged helix-turn-helix transcriptional regulator [Chromohalobacter moromii]MCK2046214.1 MarR family winged helix-turn-helix transcriptional regulator [Chromohalobacter moromii]MCT8468853.1 MarR family winged helix-turn-helix transcriptional regulator [Chromohalobacter canadensis]MCT8472957.1 MarR 